MAHLYTGAMMIRLRVSLIVELRHGASAIDTPFMDSIEPRSVMASADTRPFDALDRAAVVTPEP